ncbi:ACP S-malonyltransferase [Actinoallomurus iriomotensis]|uniref:[acyl-carrier-protein] S-malonyltransferase n=1 Tax=Actinoallomurus iriomotensis TaxID=478107 RepID=A0A9W6RLM6_9ACTN|nr:ACP S-malonyltransferase [Actinoallomurus iriomotensis]GLY77953.1 ACP S-malonyltransferase [Actinoallomurus iriomotensis]
MLAITAPGQGAQTPGFLEAWLELPGVTERLTWWSAVTGLDLIRYGTTADADEIRDTAVAQPLLVSAALVAYEVLGVKPGLVAGHSVGELAAAAMAGVISPEAALVLARERGRAMAEAAAVTETGMTAVLGGDPDEVQAVLKEHGLTPANMNGAGQVVAAGTMEQLAALKERPPSGARLRGLQVAGAFHTTHMAPAVDTLRRITPGMPVADPGIQVLSNRDGTVVGRGGDLVARLAEQVSNPVRWDSCMETMTDLGVTAIIELPPAGTLAGIARRALPGVEVVALKTPDKLDQARALAEASPSDDTLENA